MVYVYAFIDWLKWDGYGNKRWLWRKLEKRN